MRKSLWLAMIVASGVPAQEPPVMVRLDPTSLELPRRIGPLMATGEAHKYKEAGLGTSWQYNAPGASLTVYVYDSQVAELPEGPDNTPVCLEFEFAKQGIQQSYQDPRLISEHRVRLLPPADVPAMREAAFEYLREGHQTLSYVWITTVEKQFIKLRFSADQRLRDEMPEARRAILSAFGAAIQPHLAPVDPAAEKPGNSIGFNLGSADDAGEGLLYTMFLNAVVAKTPELAPVCGGEVVPPYETELSLYRGLFVDQSADEDSKFSKQVKKIDAAGYLDEFVWVELHRPSWGETAPDGLNLPDYKTWKKKNLKRFKVPQFGTVSVDYPRPLPLEAAGEP